MSCLHNHFVLSIVLFPFSIFSVCLCCCLFFLLHFLIPFPLRIVLFPLSGKCFATQQILVWHLWPLLSLLPPPYWNASSPLIPQLESPHSHRCRESCLWASSALMLTHDGAFCLLLCKMGKKKSLHSKVWSTFVRVTASSVLRCKMRGSTCYFLRCAIN